MTQTFESLGLPAKLLQSLARMEFTAPTPIQAESIPLAMQGHDILGSAQTGTGKTGAFCIPVVARMMDEPESTAIIMTPTRELAAQIVKQLHQIIPVPDMRTALLIGGEPMPKQFQQLSRNPRIIVGTPGRINDHLDRGTLKLNNAHYLVLDETDRMLDMGFGVQLETIVEALPEKRQTLMFSATLPKGIVKLSSKYLNNPQRISVGSTTTPAANIVQEVVRTSEDDKYTHLIDALNTREGSIIVFVKTKHGADKMARRLSREEYTADAIHGDLQQRRRDKVIQAFRDKKYRILVATDVAARGLDIPHIEHVINYDLPQCPEDYIHRIGRTARAGAEGAALNLVTPSDRSKWSAIERLMNPDAKPEHSNDDNRDSRGRNSRNGSKKKAFGGYQKRDYSGKSSFNNRNGEGRFERNERSEGNRDYARRDGGNRDHAPRGDRNESRDFRQGDFRQSEYRQDGNRERSFGGGGGRGRFENRQEGRSENRGNNGNYARRDRNDGDNRDYAPRGDRAPKQEYRSEYRGDRQDRRSDNDRGGYQGKPQNKSGNGKFARANDSQQDNRFGQKKSFGGPKRGNDFKKKSFGGNGGSKFAARAS